MAALVVADYDFVVWAIFSADGRRLQIIRFQPGLTLVELDAATGALLSTYTPPAAADEGCTALSRDGQLLAYSVGSAVRVFDLVTQTERFAAVNEEHAVRDCWLSPSGCTLLTALNDEDYSYVLRRTDTGEVLRVSSTGVDAEFFEFNCDATRLLAAGTGGDLLLFDVASGTCLRTLNGHTGAVNGCAFSACGSFYASCSSDCFVKVWDASSGACLATLRAGSHTVCACVFSPCGSLLLSYDQRSLGKLWQVSTGKCVRTFDLGQHRHRSPRPTDCCFSPDGMRVSFISSADNAINIFDISAEHDAFSRFGVPPPPRGGMRADMLALLRSGEDADVTLRTACGATFRAHRLILRMRSATLEAQLSGRHSGAVDDVAVPSDIASPVVARLLEFMYADALAPPPGEPEEAAALLRAAGFFGVPRLAALCETALARALRPATAATTLLLADAHAAGALRDAALRFVAAHAHDVMSTPGWRALLAAQPLLAADVTYTVVHKRPPVREHTGAALAAAARQEEEGAAAGVLVSDAAGLVAPPPGADGADGAADGAELPEGEGRRTRQRRQ
jgi:hypothetical protein